MTADSDFEVLFEAHYDDLLRFALRRVQQREDAADVVAEAWATAWRRPADLPPEDECRLWLFGVVNKTLANQRRGQQRRRQLAERLQRELARDDRPQVADHEPLERALASLSITDRDLLGMLAWEGLTVEEVAAVLGCSASTARVRAHRARRRLRAALAAEGFPAVDRVVLRPAEETP